jgi:hypothetical protein
MMDKTLEERVEDLEKSFAGLVEIMQAQGVMYAASRDLVDTLAKKIGLELE